MSNFNVEITGEGGVHPITGKNVNPNDRGFIDEINKRKYEYLVKEQGLEENIKKIKDFHDEWTNYIKNKIPPESTNIENIILGNSDIQNFTKKIKNEIVSNPSFPKKYLSTFINLFKITEKRSDTLLFEHLMEVALLSTLVGTKENSSEEDINSFLLGGLLHDVGMLRIPPSILHKKTTLTDQEKKEIQKHPLYSAQIIKLCFPLESSLNQKIFCIGLQHHWNRKGTGYFRQDIYEPKFHYLFHAKVVGICDTYSALIEHRPYRNAIEPFEAIQEIEKMRRKNYFEGELFNMFIEEMGRIPNSTYVKVADTKLKDTPIKEMLPGIVIEQNERFPNTPNVKILDGSNKILNINDLSTRFKIVAVYYKGRFVRI